MDGKIASLTDREREVLQLLLEGHTAKSAASELGLSVHTINDYLREARKKLGVGSSKEAARLLAASRNSPPENIVPEQIGMGSAAEAIQNDGPPMEAGTHRRRAIWAIGVIIMLAAIAAIALITSSNGVFENNPEVTASTVSSEDQALRAAATEWVKLIDRGAWRDSWENSSSYFKSQVSADSWAAQAMSARGPLGDVTLRSLQRIDHPEALPGAPEGDYRVLQFATEFSDSGKRIETVVLMKDRGEWKAAGYFIR